MHGVSLWRWRSGLVCMYVDVYVQQGAEKAGSAREVEVRWKGWVALSVLCEIKPPES
jgi:hypothetical protein